MSGVAGTSPARREERLARVYDDEILPVWDERFGRLLLRGLALPPRATVLDVGCGTGHATLEVLRRLDEGGRLVAIDPSSAMLAVARKKAGDLAGKRVFFRTESLVQDGRPRLPFTDDVYDVVVSNGMLAELSDPGAALRELVRVTKVGGRIACTLPLAGTWGELHDLYREVLVKHDRHETLERLEAHLASLPTEDTVRKWLSDAGLEGAEVEVEPFRLLFRSSREFFFAPVVEHGPLARWKAIAGKGQELQDVFWHIKEAIDAYFGGRAFEITVVVACLRGHKAGPHSERSSGGAEGALARDGGDVGDGGLADDGRAVEPALARDPEVVQDDAEADDDLEVFRRDLLQDARPRRGRTALDGASGGASAGEDGPDPDREPDGAP